MKKWTIFLVFVLGCTGSKNKPSCEPGYLWTGDACTKQVDIHFSHDITDVTDSDNGVMDIDTDTIKDTGNEVWHGDTNAPLTIGAACTKAVECNGISTETDCVPDTPQSDAGCVHYNNQVECLSNDKWKDGYCGLRDCLNMPCPSGSVCITVGPQNAWCVAPCENDADCRTAEGYNCKSVLTSSGMPARACLPSGMGDTGDTCTIYSDCKGRMDCLTDFKEGYCAMRGCSKDSPCPDGSACVELNAGSACLKSCKTDGDCNTGNINDRTCSKLHSAISDGDKESVCVVGSGGKKIGDACTQGYECDSNDCSVVYRGICKDTNIPCNSTSDCEGRFCDTTDPKSILGYCTKDCSSNTQSCGSTSHSGPAVCIATNNGDLCMPACIAQPCTISSAMTCAYGFDESGLGLKTYCMPKPEPGDWGTYCTQDSDCHNDSQFPECLKGDKGYGYCSGIPTHRDVNGDRQCPFPMRYVIQTRHLCLKYCRPGKNDCKNLPADPAPGSSQTELTCKMISDGNFCIPPSIGTN